MVAFEDNSKDFSISSISTQLELLLAETILEDLDILLEILLKERQIDVNSIKCLEYQDSMAI